MSDPYVCPDCGRDKALTIQDAVAGKCPKWWAVRDRHADLDCSNFKERKGAYENYREPGEFGEGATVRRAEPPSQHFLDLLDQYWKAAYQQGLEGRNHDDKEGSAQIAESALCAYVEGLRVQLIRMVEIAERRLIDLSAARASLYKIAAYDDAAANAYLRATGSYRCFDEPGAVEMARGVLEGRS